MAQVFTSLMFTGFIIGPETRSFAVLPVWAGEVDALSIYPQAGIPGVILRLDNIRTQRYVETNEWRWRLLFDVTNLSGFGVVYEVYWTRIFP